MQPPRSPAIRTLSSLLFRQSDIDLDLVRENECNVLAEKALDRGSTYLEEQAIISGTNNAVARRQGGGIANVDSFFGGDVDDEDIPPLTGPSIRLQRSNQYVSPDMPPSPHVLSGGWISGRDGPLLLPPPFLDDATATPKASFDGIFGTTAVLEASRTARREARLRGRDRPPKAAFPESLFIALSKLCVALGPPSRSKGDIDDERRSRTWKRRRRTRVAQDALAGVELAQKWRASVLAALPEGYRDEAKIVGDTNVSIEEITRDSIIRTATPTSVLFPWPVVASPEMVPLFTERNHTGDYFNDPFIHTFAFVYFIIIHLFAFLDSAYGNAISAGLLVRWIALNLAGRTVLSKTIYEYFILCRNEWRAVYEEDRVALGVWSVLLGLLELVAVQSMSRRRYLSDGPGELESLIGGEESAGVIATDSRFDLSSIKRLIRLSTASYGLHTFISSAPSPLFSPSGTALSRHVFSHLGRIDETNVLHFALQQDYSEDDTSGDTAYSPQFYLVRDTVRREIVVVIRGTQSLSDIKTDLEANLIELTLPSLMESDQMESYRMHVGIHTAAKRFIRRDSALFMRVVQALGENAGYALILTGHSLGAAIASAVAVLISQFDNNHWTTHLAAVLPNRRIQAVCFAHPTTFDVALSRRCAAGAFPFISVSLMSDIVCRFGIPQVRELRRSIGRLATKRSNLFQPKQGQRGQFEILSNWWRWKRLGAIDSTHRSTEQQEGIVLYEARAWRWREEMDGLRENEGERLMLIPAGACYHLDLLADYDFEERRRAELVKVMHPDDDVDEIIVIGFYRVNQPEYFYSTPLLDGEALSSHFPKVYLDHIESLSNVESGD